jgi:tyrosine-protein phosphatase SIW14
MERKPSQWADADKLAATLAALDTSLTTSKTIQRDESHPPTPDDSGKPNNFQVIAPGLYRSSYPHYTHYDQLSLLELKTIVTLVPENLTVEYANFLSSNGIIHHHIPILANKKEDIYTDEATINTVLNIMLDPSNYPMLIHCNKGKHRTGCMTACFRKVTGWTMDAILDEYVKYSTPKSRDLDKAFIERYDPSALKPLAFNRGYVGGVYRQPILETTRSSEYTNNTVETTNTNGEEEWPNSDYQKRAFEENEAIMASSRLWSHR